MEITRSSILMDCLEETNRELHKYSKHGNGLLPLEGYENHFDDLNETCRLLRAMIIENQAREKEAGQEEVHASKPLADWQMEIIRRDAEREEDGPIRQMMVGGARDGGKKQAGLTADEAVLRRRYRRAEGFKPEPVILTDESGVYLNGEKILPQPVTYPGGEE